MFFGDCYYRLIIYVLSSEYLGVPKYMSLVIDVGCHSI